MENNKYKAIDFLPVAGLVSFWRRNRKESDDDRSPYIEQKNWKDNLYVVYQLASVITATLLGINGLEKILS